MSGSNRNASGKWSRHLAALCVLCILELPGYGQLSDHAVAARFAASKERPTVGLVLEGGGALGIAHIGVLKWLREHQVPVDGIAGTSMGALIGSLAATGETPQEIEHLVTDGRFDDLFTLRPSLTRISFRRRQDRDDLPQAVSIGLRGGRVSLGNSIIADERLNAFLARQLLGYNSEALHFDEMPIPFRCVATDLTTLRPAVFDSGSLAFAVRASISIPGVFPPVQKDGHYLVDGAIMNNLPTGVAREDLHTKIVISVYLGDDPLEEKDAGSLVGVFERALQAGTSRNVELSRSQADIEIQPQLGKLTAVDYQEASLLIRLGYEAAERQRNGLLRFALDEKNWHSYLEEVDSRRRSTPGVIRSVRVEGPSAKISAELANSLEKLQGKPFDAAKTENAVSDLRGEGVVDAYYETFPSATAKIAPKSGSAADDAIALHWQRKPEGPPYLLLGTDVVAMTSNVTKTLFDLRFIDPNRTGFGSEWRSTLQMGYLTRVNTEYYQPFGRRGFFIQPLLSLLRQPVYLWENQKRISERNLQEAGGGFDAGLMVNRNLQAAVEYRASTLHWSLRDGQDNSPTPYLSGKTQTAALHLIYNNRTAEVAAPKGSQIDLRAGYLYDTTGSHSTPFLRAGLKQSYTIAEKNLLSLSADIDTYFRANVTDPLRPTLGGPLRLYASSIDEYRGTDTALTRLIYLRRVASLPTGLGHGVYLTGGVEAGNIWSPERHAILRQDGFGGVLVSTPLGALTLGGAVGDAGRRKVFFTFGKLF